MTEMKKEEKRRYVRVPAAALIEIETAGGPDAPREPAETLNMSIGGILFAADSELPVGRLIRFRLDLDSIFALNTGIERGEIIRTGYTIEAAGRVVRVKGAPEIGYEIAVSIENIKPEDAEALGRLLGM